ncbi:MAG: hypothetical protein E4H38_05565 [Gemmatimonadales bacterium]|nr:MAG: hypothetical protein E4H38_05565 [Gemmatimonadales bacterium]
MLSRSLHPVLCATAIALSAVLVLACDRNGPHLRAAWDGPKAGKLRAAPTAAWCPRARRLEVGAIREDVGVALAIYPEEALGAGRYEAFDPGRYAMQRPGSAAALRWFTEQEVKGYQSDSGVATVTMEDGKYGVQFGYRLVSVTLTDTLRVTGQATGLIPGACPADDVSQPSDSG